MDPRRTRFLRQTSNQFFHLFANRHHQVGEFIHQHNNIRQFFQHRMLNIHTVTRLPVRVRNRTPHAGGFGTALGVIRAGVAAGRIDQVFAGETRPWNQGARLTVWELQQDGIDATLIADAAASHLMKTAQVQWVIVGADRICANGDTANKIGTYQLAIAARHHGVEFMVVAPSSTVDMDTASGELIEIEERDTAELLSFKGARTVSEGVRAWNPVFDVTPHDLIDAIVTEQGVVERPDAASMQTMFQP